MLKKASEEIEMTYPRPPEFVAQGDRVLVVGVARGKIKATNKMFEDHWVFVKPLIGTEECPCTAHAPG